MKKQKKPETHKAVVIDPEKYLPAKYEKPPEIKIDMEKLATIAAAVFAATFTMIHDRRKERISRLKKKK